MHDQPAREPSDTAATPPKQGSCLCGGVRYEVRGPFRLAEYCHCSRCRKWHGCAFSANAVLKSKDFAIVSGHELIGEYASSPNRRRCFCSRCGSPVFIRRLNAPELTVVTLGTLDSPAGFEPEQHVFVASKAEWHHIHDSLPRYEVFPGHDEA